MRKAELEQPEREGLKGVVKRGAVRGAPPFSPESRALGLQRAIGNRAVRALLIGPVHQGCIQRDTEVREPTEADYRSAVEAAITVFEGAAQRFAIGPPDIFSRVFQQEVARHPVRGGPLVHLLHDVRAAEEADRRARDPGEMLREISRILQAWLRVYNSARGFITAHLRGDAALAGRLRSAYLRAVEALHRSARNRTPRVSINLVAAPPGPGADQFIRNATAYARSYYSRPVQPGDIVQTVEGVGGLDDLFDSIERVHPERLIRRIDIFAHGTIQPTNQIRFGNRWYTTDQIQAAATARRFRGEYVQSIARFDEHSALEIHACRLGAGQGRRFLETTGRAIGGVHGQSVTGYTQRWFPRRRTVAWQWRDHGTLVHDELVRNTQADIYGPNALPDRFGHPGDHDPFIARFENYAVRLFDRVVAGSVEVRPFLNAAERAGGPVIRARKIEIMRAMYDQNGAWLLGFQHPAAHPPVVEPTAAIGSPRYTYTREAGDWQARTLQVQVRPLAPQGLPP